MGDDNVSLRSSQSFRSTSQIGDQSGSPLLIENKSRSKTFSSYGNVSQESPSVQGEQTKSIMQKAFQSINELWKSIAFKLDSRKEIKQIKSKVKEIEKKSIEEKSKLETINKKIKVKEDTILKVETKINGLKNKVSLEKEEMNILKQRSTELRKKMENAGDKNIEILLEIQELKKQLETLKKEGNTESTEKHNQLINEAEKKLENQIQFGVSLENEEAKNNQLIEKKTKNIEGIEYEIDQKTNNTQKLKKDVDTLKLKINNSYREVKGELESSMEGLMKIKIETKTDTKRTRINSFQKVVQKRNEKTIEKKINKINEVFNSSTLSISTTKELSLSDEIKDSQKKLSEIHKQSSDLIVKSGFEEKIFTSQLNNSKKESESILLKVLEKVINNEKTESFQTTAGKEGEDSQTIQETPEQRYNRVFKEAEGLIELVKEHKDLQKYAYDISHEVEVLTNPKTPVNERMERLQNLSDAMKLVESEFTNREVISRLSNSDTIALKKEEIKIKSYEDQYKQIKEALKKVNENTGLKIVLKWVDGKTQISTTPRETNPPIKALRTSGSSREAKDTINYILQELSHCPTKTELRKEANEILGLLEKRQNWTKDVFAEHQEILSKSFNGAKKILEIDKQPENIDLEKKQSVSSQPKAEPSVDTTNLTNKLLLPPVNSSFERNFLNTYRTLIKEITGKTEGSESERLFSFFEENFSKTDFYGKQQIMKLAQEWVSNSFVNGGEVKSNDVLVKIKGLIKVARNENSSTLNELASKIENSLDEASKPVEPISIPNGDESLGDLINDIKSDDIKVGSEKYQKAVKDFAQSLTSRSEFLFKSINSLEFKNGAWGKKDENGKSVQAPNIQNYTDEFNAIGYFIVQSILGEKNTQKESAKIMEFFLHVQKQLISEKENGPIDFYSCMAIQAGLEESSIGRLTKVRELIPKNSLEIANNMNELFSHSSNYKNIKTAIQNSPGAIPFFPLYLTEITFANEGNLSKIKGHINVKKFEMLGQTISLVENKQKEVKHSSFKPRYDMSKMPFKRDKNFEYLMNEKSLKLQAPQKN